MAIPADAVLRISLSFPPLLTRKAGIVSGVCYLSYCHTVLSNINLMQLPNAP
jgi:hypothetical protein